MSWEVAVETCSKKISIKNANKFSIDGITFGASKKNINNNIAQCSHGASTTKIDQSSLKQR